MDKRFDGIKVLIWDIDGTFYKMVPEIKKQYREREIKVIMNRRGWSRDKAEEEFYKILPLIKSGTETAARLGRITTREAAIEVEQYIDRITYLSYDEKLVELFQKLTSFTHYLLVNGIKKKTIETLTHLGLRPEQFQEIVSSEVVGENKPLLGGFRYILDKTKLAPERHLMIGDREEIDLVPAKNLGMKTCLVWSETQSKIADITLPTVYEIGSLFFINKWK